jgi:hypothetical protein
MYALVCATGGLFAFVWSALMLRDASLAGGGRSGWVFLSTLLLGGLVLYLLLFFLLLSSSFTSPIHYPLIAVEAVLALALFCLELVFVVVINSRIHTALNAVTSVRDNVFLVILTFVMFISLVVLQRRLNRVVAQNSPSSTELSRGSR